MTDTSPTPQASLFDRMGGAPGVARLIDTFYDRMESLEQARAIRAMHPADLGPTREVFKRYLGEWLGGPALYSAEKGHPRLRMRHMHVAITSADRDAWLACMAEAMVACIQDIELRAAIWDPIARLADWMRNAPDPAG